MLNLLLVEDNDIDVLALKRALRHAAITHQMHHATDGDHALELLLGGVVPRHHLLILLDLEMPRMHGLAFLDQLRRTPALASIPVLVLTASTNQEHRSIAHQRNCAGFFSKPLDFDALVKLVRDIESYWTKSHFSP